jgi:hypothetical protein
MFGESHQPKKKTENCQRDPHTDTTQEFQKTIIFDLFHKRDG